jgi:hypothetical protein
MLGKFQRIEKMSSRQENDKYKRREIGEIYRSDN